MYRDEDYQPEERDELFYKLRKLINAEVKKELGNKEADHKWLQKERVRINSELSAARLKIRELENERSKFLREHTKAVQRELFGGFTVGDVVYYAKSHKAGEVNCDTCNNTRKVEMRLGERVFVKDCPDCGNYYSRIIYEYRPQRDKVTQINTKLCAGGERRELEIWLYDRDGCSKESSVFRTIEECQAYCDELNKKERAKQMNNADEYARSAIEPTESA